MRGVVTGAVGGAAAAAAACCCCCCWQRRVRQDGSRISISGSGLGCLLSSGHRAHVLSPPVTGSSLVLSTTFLPQIEDLASFIFLTTLSTAITMNTSGSGSYSPTCKKSLWYECFQHKYLSSCGNGGAGPHSGRSPPVGLRGTGCCCAGLLEAFFHIQS